MLAIYIRNQKEKINIVCRILFIATKCTLCTLQIICYILKKNQFFLELTSLNVSINKILKLNKTK